MNTLDCAMCGESLAMDDNQVWIEAEHVQTEYANESEEFIFCPDCWEQASKEFDPV